jgi:uncharacterized protein (DUF983 family)
MGISRRDGKAEAVDHHIAADEEQDFSVIDAHPGPGLLLRRALTLRCPYCGSGKIFKGWLTLKGRCPRCHSLFEREPGYFVGGYALNLIVAEFLAFGTVLLLLVFADLSTLQLQITGALLALGLPIIFFPFSRTLWIALDLFLHPPGPNRG